MTAATVMVISEMVKKKVDWYDDDKNNNHTDNNSAKVDLSIITTIRSLSQASLPIIRNYQHHDNDKNPINNKLFLSDPSRLHQTDSN